MPTPRHVPNDATRVMVESMAQLGVDHERIAKALGITPPTLRKYYRDALDIAETKLITLVGNTLAKKALGNGPQSVSAAIFILKARAGWSDRVAIDALHRGPGEGDKGAGPIRIKVDFV